MRDNKKWNFTESKRAFAFFPKIFPVNVSDSDLELLKKTSFELQRKNGRLCLHESESSKVHQMVVLEHAHYFYSPHYHDGDAECFMLIDGQLGVITFSEDGNFDSSRLLEKHQFYKVGSGVVHAVFPVSDYCIYYESKGGPYVPEKSNLKPKWVPKSEEEIASYKESASRFLGIK